MKRQQSLALHQSHITVTLTTCGLAAFLAVGSLYSTRPVWAATAPTNTTPAPETPAQRDARMKWWREAKFGMFIHWGVYSVPAGFYHDKPVGGIGEWIMNSAKIPVTEYRAFAKQFNPVQYDADAFVRAAKDAGMKYIVITAKHHDGFAMFDSKASDWNIVKATPYGKDVLRQLAAACKRQGMRLGFYYSQAQDWNNPGGGVCGTHWDPAQEGDMDAYIKNVAVPEVREILSHYGPVSVLWWDTPCGMTPERAAPLYQAAKELQPNIIMNNRLGGNFPGDTETPEQFVPATGYPGRDWETCMTMNNTWGFKKDDNDWKSPDLLIHNLVDIVSKGGNYLLNVGPTAQGLIPSPSLGRLQAIGRWMKVNHEAIYATTASPFKKLPWGRCTTKRMGANTTLFLHVWNWPQDGKLRVPGLKNAISSASLLADGRKLSAATDESGATIAVPATAPDAISSTIVLKIKGAPDVAPTPLLQDAATGALQLPAIEATLHGKLQYESGGGKDNIGYWLDPADWVEWPFKATRPGTYTVSADIAAMGTGSFEVILDGQKLKGTTPNTGDYAKFQTVELGTLKIDAPGSFALQIRPVAEGWQPMNLKAIRFTAVP